MVIVPLFPFPDHLISYLVAPGILSHNRLTCSLAGVPRSTGVCKTTFTVTTKTASIGSPFSFFPSAVNVAVCDPTGSALPRVTVTIASLLVNSLLVNVIFGLPDIVTVGSIAKLWSSDIFPLVTSVPHSIVLKS